MSKCKKCKGSGKLRVSIECGWDDIIECNMCKGSGKLKGMTFGEAIQAMKDGQKVCRAGWNGKGMFIYYVEANKYPASGNKKGTMVGVFEDDMVPYQAYIAMKTSDNTVVPWLASQSDILDTDWEIIK